MGLDSRRLRSTLEKKATIEDNKFEEENDLADHIKTHSNGQKFKCNKCEREYTEMGKLRRHDWRSHREVSCNICGEWIENRQNIGNHRQEKHQIFRKSLCRFFPNCVDEDECFMKIPLKPVHFVWKEYSVQIKAANTRSHNTLI